MENSIIVLAVGAVSGIIGSIITYTAIRGAAHTRSIPDFYIALSKRVTDQEERITTLEDQQEYLKTEVRTWQDNYFKLFRWLKNFFRKNGIKELIPEFHKQKE